MKMKNVALGCYLIATLALAAFGVLYVVRSEFMPYHATAVGMEWENVDPAFQVLILALMKSFGGTALALVAIQIAVLVTAFRRGELWAKLVVPVASLIQGLTSLYVTLYVREYTPAEPPWIISVVGILLVVAGFVLSMAAGRETAFPSDRHRALR